MKKVIVVLMFFVGASCKFKGEGVSNRIEYKKKYYASGKVREQGFFLDDSLPVGLITKFYENGRIKSIYHFDSTGKANGVAISYYANGDFKRRAFFVDDTIQGMFVIVDSLTKEQDSVFSFNDNPVGDRYHFARNNKMVNYSFTDFDGRKFISIDVDTLGKIQEKLGETIFIDSLSFKTGSSGKCFQYVLLLVLSNPPRCSNKIVINYLSQDKKVLQSDFLDKTSHVFIKTEQLNPSYKYIEIKAEQYDSLSKKSSNQMRGYILE